MPDGGLQATQQATPLTTHSMSKDMILSLRQKTLFKDVLAGSAHVLLTSWFPGMKTTD